MIQRFIELGEGYSDLYELIEIARAQKERVKYLLALNTEIDGNPVTSLAIILNPTQPGNFQPIYFCREGIPNPNKIPNKRFDLFADLAETIEKRIIELEVKHSGAFAEKQLFFQYLIGILRMNRYLPPLS
ncbi:methylthioribose kinase [Peribacillus saganii]|uniref:Methylthioribose kinase n=1 Tax=Peribacillus saganii TaxID=2303992 RepID=A0A372LSJ5_9BACI|nr:methylthioribose kinase [Peribacillus saganii]RFU71153.1 methylthioribose kinase [Peribacillus saganii]